jgi:hypothetical protein
MNIDVDANDDIMAGVKLANKECIVALDDKGNAIIIAQSDWLRERDVLVEEHTDDCGFEQDWDKGLVVGVYLCRIRPWSDGVDEVGIDVVKVKPLWTVDALTLK